MSSVNSNVGYRYRLSLLLGITISVILLLWAFRGVSLESLWTALEKIQLPWLGLGLLTFVASFSVRAWRWGTLLSAREDPGSFRLRQAAVFIGFAGNAILPASAGEMIRAGLLHRLAHIPLGTIIGSIATERLLDAAIALLLLITHLPVHAGGSAQLERLPILVMSLLVLSTCGVFVVAANKPNEIAQLVGRIVSFFGLQRHRSRMTSMVQSLLAGLDALRKPRLAIIAVVQTFIIWLLTAVTYWAGLIAFGIPEPGFSGAIFLQSIVALALVIPSSPGYVGPFEAAIRFSLEFFRIPSGTVIAYALVMRVLMLVGLMTMAFASAMNLGLTHKEINHTFARARSAKKDSAPRS